MAKISIIMGVYNCKNKALLKKSVESLINQTYTDWELIICNDGSTDDTYEYLLKMKKLDNRISVVGYSKNKGLAYALNYCLKYTKGEYIARQDDDDYSYFNRLEKEIAVLDANKKFSIVGCIADVYDENGIWGKYSLKEKPLITDFLWSNPFNHPTVIFRQSALREIGGYRVSNETRRCEDYDVFMRLYSKGYRGYNIQEKLYKYWIQNDSKSKYRPMKYRIDEAIVRYKGYKAMKILIKGLPYVFKPIIIGLIPQKVFMQIRNKQYSTTK